MESGLTKDLMITFVAIDVVFLCYIAYYAVFKKDYVDDEN